MTSLGSWLSPTAMYALGWALIHFLWQGAAIAALAAVLMRFCRHPGTRYCLGVAALTLMLAMPFVTLFLFDGPASFALPVIGILALPSLPAPAELLPWVVEFWLGGVVLLSLRFAGGFILLAQRQHRQSCVAGDEILALCREVQQRLGLTRTIRYLECRWLRVPAVIGCIRPVVLLPVAALTGLSEAQLRAVIAHELAHVRRWDFLVNLFQILAETLLFYHPAIWWLNRRIRADREICCDEVAVSEIENRIEYADALVQYARALALMEEWKSAPGPAMAANHGILSERVFHILGLPREKPRLAGFAGSLLLLTASFVAAGTLIVPGIPGSVVHEPVRSGSSVYGSIDKSVAQIESPPVRETHPAAARLNAYVIPGRNRLARFRTIKPISSISMPVVIAPVDPSSLSALDDQPVVPAPQTDAPPHARSVVAEELDALTISDNEYPEPVLKLNASHSVDEWTQGEAINYCKNYAAQTVTQGANRPMAVDDGVKDRLSFFYWHCMLSNNNGLTRTYGSGLGNGPAYVAVGAASSDHPVNVAGNWAISFPSSPSSLGAMMAMQMGARICSFNQAGNIISGTCAGREGSSVATGIIDGRQVRWSWIYTFHDGRRKGEMDFLGMVGPDGVLTGQSIAIEEVGNRLEAFKATPGGPQVASQQ